MLAENQRNNFELRKRKEERFTQGEPKRVALAMRVSTPKQIAKGEIPDIPAQRDQLLEFVKTQKWIPAMKNGNMIEYIEVSSAYKKSRHDREAIVQAINGAEQDDYDILLFFKNDRLSRISEEYPTILRDLWDMGCEPWDYQQKQPLRIKTQSEKVMRFLEGWQSETESVNTSFRVTENMKLLARSGDWLGGKNPYGYKYSKPEVLNRQDKHGKNRLKVKMGIEIDNEEAKIVIMIFDLYINGYGSTSICKILNNPPHNIKKRNGKPLDHSMILGILKNPIYIGRLSWGKTSKREKFFQRIPKEDWIFSEERQEQYRIISDEIFFKAQEILERNREQTSKGKKISRRTFGSERLLAGLAFCGYCGEPMLSKSFSNPAKNYKRDGYTCRSHKRRAFCEAKRHFIEKNTLENVVLFVIEEFIFSVINKNKDELLKEIHNKYHINTDENTKEILKLTQKINELKRLKNYYVAEHQKIIVGEETEIPREIVIEQMKKISDELKQLEETLIIFEKQKETQPLSLKDLDKLLSDLSNWTDLFKRSNFTKQKNLLSKLVNKVLVYDDQIKVCLIFGYEKIVQNIGDYAFNDVEEFLSYVKNITTDKIENAIFSVSNDKPIRSDSQAYWNKVKEWEVRIGKPFGFIIGEMRKEMSSEEVIKKTGISKWFLYTYFGKYMDKISYVEIQYGKSLGDVVKELREECSMEEISNQLGLAITTLYNHLRKK